jgi:hypothetical protein
MNFPSVRRSAARSSEHAGILPEPRPSPGTRLAYIAEKKDGLVWEFLGRRQSLSDCRQKQGGKLMRLRTTLSILIVGLTLLLASRPVAAHHTMFAEFDITKSITLRGAVTKMEWVNPHGWIYIDVKRANGQVEHWAIETGSPVQMKKRGLNVSDFQVGTEIIVGGFPARAGKPTMAGWIVTFVDREATSPDREASFALGR